MGVLTLKDLTATAITMVCSAVVISTLVVMGAKMQADEHARTLSCVAAGGTMEEVNRQLQCVRFVK